MTPYPLTLEGHVIRLEPLTKDHIDPLYTLALANPEEFRFTSTPITPEQREHYFQKALNDKAENRAHPFTVFLKESNAIIGTTRLADINWQDLNCELGYTWFNPSYYGTAVNVESKHLLLSFVFEDLQFLRVQIHTDTRNTRSEAAIRALGARHEGILRSHKIAKDGHIRDTTVFSIIHSDWDEVGSKLKKRIARKLL